MADRVFVGDRATNVDISPTFNTYSKVIIHISDDKAITVGNNTGRTLELDNPFGTKKMAQDILTRLSGYQYQPYKADDALLNPAAEVGDTISVSSAYGMMFTRSRQFGRLMTANISAPCDEEINHEYTYESPQERKFTRVTSELSASIVLTQESIASEVLRREEQGDEFSSRLKQTADSITSEVNRATAAEGTLRTSVTQTAEEITAEVTRATAEEGTLRSSIQQNATEIAAKVSQVGGDNSSFGWSLRSSEFGLYAGSNKVFWVNSAGANVKGSITATSGYIGNGSSGFAIGTTYIRNGMTSLGDTSHDGIYIGTNGISLGRGKFKVTSEGAITATSGKIGGFTINSNNLNYNELQWGDTDKNGVYIGTSGIQLGKNFSVSSSGYVQAKNLVLTGGSIKLGDLGNNTWAFTVTNAGSVSATNLAIKGGSINLGDGAFRVTSDGKVYASALFLTGGSISMKDSEGNTAFQITQNGTVTANNMRLGGTMSIAGNQISAANLYTGSYQASQNYSSWNGAASSVSSNGPSWSAGAQKGTTAYNRSSSAWIGYYRLSFGTGITILGGEFTDSMGGMCSGYATRSNVVTAQYAGGYD